MKWKLLREEIINFLSVKKKSEFGNKRCVFFLFIRIRPPVWWSIHESKNKVQKKKEKCECLNNFSFWLSRGAPSWTRFIIRCATSARFTVTANGDSIAHAFVFANSPRHFLASKLHRELHQQRQLDSVLASTWSYRVMCWVFQCHLLTSWRNVSKSTAKKKVIIRRAQNQSSHNFLSDQTTKSNESDGKSLPNQLLWERERGKMKTTERKTRLWIAWRWTIIKLSKSAILNFSAAAKAHDCDKNISSSAGHFHRS